MQLLWLMLSVLLLVLFQGIVFGSLAILRVHYQRFFSKQAVYAGEKVEMVEIMRNQKLLPVPMLKVETRMSAHLHFKTTAHEALSVDDVYHRSLFFLMPFTKVTRRYEMLCTRRGVYNVGTVAITAGDLFGVGRRTRLLDVGAELVVYPRILGENEINLPSSRMMGEVVVRRWIVDDPFLVGGVREYHAGDSQKDVHWRATAHTGQLQVKVRERTADPRVMVLFNVQPSETLWEHIPDSMHEDVDYGISICATLCMRALEAGVEAGFATNAPGIADAHDPVFVRPARSLPQAELLMETMARIRPKIQHSLHTFAERAFTADTDIDVLLVSAYDDEIVRQTLEVLRRRGYHASLYVYPPRKEVA